MRRSVGSSVWQDPTFSTAGPRVTITPIWDADPPIWDSDVGLVPAVLGALFVPLPAPAASRVRIATVVPFYTEEGYALARTLQALALQRDDLRRAARAAGEVNDDALPEMHVLAIADGWAKPDGTPIVSDTMLDELSDIFGPTLDLVRLGQLMGETGLGALPPDDDEESTDGDGEMPAAVLIQFVVTAPAGSSGAPGGWPHRDVLHPLPLDCTLALSSQARAAQNISSGSTADAVRIAERIAGRESTAAPAAPAQAASLNRDLMRKSAASASNELMLQGSFSNRDDGCSVVLGEEGGSSRSSGGVRERRFVVEGSDSGSSAGFVIGEVDGGVVLDDAGGGGSSSRSSGNTITGRQADMAAAASAVRPLFLSLLIKRRNHKKHHSHRWHFEAFAPVTRLRAGPGGCPFYFATDAGALYAPFLLSELVQHMDSHPACAAATAYQRAMDVLDQVDPLSDAGTTWAWGILHDVQAYDYESGQVLFSGVHALAGFLAVVPGPCGLFRAAATTNNVISRVRDIVSSHSRDDGLIQGNLKIAEDRILSYLLVLCPSTDPVTGVQRWWETHWVPSTTFYFETEGTLHDFVFQRRRWLNGTFAGFVWLLYQPALWHAILRGRVLAVLVVLLCLLQLLIIASLFALPGLLIVINAMAFRGITLALLVVGGREYMPVGNVILDALPVVSTWVGTITYLAHIGFARLGSTPYTKSVWMARVALNAVMQASLLCSLGSLAVLVAVAPDRVAAVVGPTYVRQMQAAGTLGLLTITTPFFAALALSPSTFQSALAAYPNYWFLLPTVLSDFMSYSFARFDDLSWGTKAVASVGPSSGAGATGGGRLALHRAAEARRGMGGSATGTPPPPVPGAATPFSAPSAHWSERRALLPVLRTNAAAATASWRSVNAVVIAQAMLVVVIVSASVEASVLPFLFLVSGGAALMSFIVSALSLLYFVPRTLCSRAGGGVFRRLGAAANILGWLWVVACSAIVIIEGIFSNTLPARLPHNPVTTDPWRAALWGLYAGYAAVALLAILRFTRCGGGRATHPQVPVARN